MNHDSVVRREAARDRTTGEFGHQGRTAPGDLHSEPRGSWRERAEALRGEGYVEAVASPTRFKASDTSYRRLWWAEKFVSAEYGHDEGAFAQMPDDNSPSMGGGRALSGHRRTYRSRYGRGTGDVQMRMPSKAAMMRFHKNDPKATFDVPVAMEEPDGRTMQGFVRVTPGADGSWTAEGLGFPADQEVLASEAVASILESRRPTMVDLRPETLRARYLERTSSSGVEMEHLSTSSWIGAGGYDESTQTMYLEMNGRTYGYQAHRDDYDFMMASTSPGRTFNLLFKGKLERSAVTSCPRCRRTHLADRNHHCPGEQVRTAEASRATDKIRAHTRFAWWLRRSVTTA